MEEIMKREKRKILQNSYIVENSIKVMNYIINR